MVFVFLYCGMTAKTKMKILEVLSDKNNQVFFIEGNKNRMTHFEVYNANGDLIIDFNEADVDKLLFNAKLICINGDETQKQVKLLSDLQEKNKDVEPLYSI